MSEDIIREFIEDLCTITEPNAEYHTIDVLIPKWQKRLDMSEKINSNNLKTIRDELYVYMIEDGGSICWVDLNTIFKKYIDEV